MIIDEPYCGFVRCKHYFDGNCVSKEKYSNCEYPILSFVLNEIRFALEEGKGIEEVKKIMELLN